VTVTVADSGNKTTTVDSSRHTVVANYSTDLPTVVVFQIDLSNMAGGDTIDIYISTGAGPNDAINQQFIGVQTLDIWTSDPLPINNGTYVDYKHSAGVSITFDWILYRVGG
jgi:hypothetical protein